MKGLMMDYQLTLPTILRRAEALFGKKEIVSRLPDKSIHRYTYHDFTTRTKKLAVALHQRGMQQGDRVATLCWNHYQHLELYFAIPCMGAIVHPLNVRLSTDDLSYIVNHAEDKIIVVDEVLLPLFEKFKHRINVSKVIVVSQGRNQLPAEYLNYEEVVASGDETLFEPFDSDEYAGAFMCYTSGTTGRPKGILYSHRSIMLHAMSVALSCTGVGINERDVILPIVPMFHAGAWCFPYSCAFVGATQVFSGAFLDAESLLQLFESEKVTLTAGVPTVMMNILNALEKEPGKYRLFLRLVIMGGSSAPRYLAKSFDENYGIEVVHTWGMTELSPLGSTSVMNTQLQNASKEEQYDHIIKKTLPIPFVEIRGRNEDGFIPWDGVTMGELEVRGPCVCSAYYKAELATEEKFTGDGWLKTGDIVAIAEGGLIEIKDRSKDVIKSGGEWISSVALENSLMCHPSILEAAVIGIPDDKWIERPFAYIVLKEGKNFSPAELNEFLAGKFARFWIPDGYKVIDTIPKTSVGKFLKSALREKYLRERE
jgi:fatty-acyl-CoA synthase